MVLPALVTKIVGTLKVLMELSTRNWKAFGVVGRTDLPRTMTPSMSNIRPKVGEEGREVENEEEGWVVEKEEAEIGREGLSRVF